MFDDLRGKTAIITGASRGIGRQLALALASHGVRLTLASRKLAGVQAVAEEVRAQGGQALAVPAHMGEREQVAALVRRTVEHWGGLDILMNNAATNPHYGPLLSASEAQMEKIMDVNLMGYFRLCQQGVPHLIRAGGGKIINIASIAGLRPGAGMGAYSISKAAVIMLTQVLARELGQHNIQVNALAPGVVKTKFSRALWQEPEREQAIAGETPLGRLGEPQDLVGAALLLASAASDWMTGAVIVVDGGLQLSGGLA